MQGVILGQAEDAVPGQQHRVAVGDDELGIAGDADQDRVAGDGDVLDGLARKSKVLRQQDLVQAGSAAAQREQLADGVGLDLPVDWEKYKGKNCFCKFCGLKNIRKELLPQILWIRTPNDKQNVMETFSDKMLGTIGKKLMSKVTHFLIFKV